MWCCLLCFSRWFYFCEVCGRNPEVRKFCCTVVLLDFPIFSSANFKKIYQSFLWYRHDRISSGSWHATCSRAVSRYWQQRGKKLKPKASLISHRPWYFKTLSKAVSVSPATVKKTFNSQLPVVTNVGEALYCFGSYNGPLFDGMTRSVVNRISEKEISFKNWKIDAHTFLWTSLSPYSGSAFVKILWFLSVTRARSNVEICYWFTDFMSREDSYTDKASVRKYEDNSLKQTSTLPPFVKFPLNNKCSETKPSTINLSRWRFVSVVLACVFYSMV